GLELIQLNGPRALAGAHATSVAHPGCLGQVVVLRPSQGTLVRIDLEPAAARRAGLDGHGRPPDRPSQTALPAASSSWRSISAASTRADAASPRSSARTRAATRSARVGGASVAPAGGLGSASGS